MKMKNKINILLLLSIIAIVGCRKKSSTFEGPSIDEIYSNFKLIQPFKANKDSVNFATGDKVVFTAQFNKIVEWTISIKGKTSQAEKIIKGSSKTIDATNATWNGSTTNFPVFGIEDCDVLLTIKDVADSFKVSEKIIGKKTNPGFTIADFETGLLSTWTKFIQTGADMDFKVKTDNLAPEGGSYLNMAGTVNWDWLIGLIDFPASAYGTANTLPLKANPDAVYFNAMVYGEPNTNPSIVLFQIKEDENADGVINANNEDQYDLEIRVDWSGWKLVSIKYNDIPSLVNGAPATPKGNALHNPDKIGKISMLHLANPSDGFASSKLDYIIFTDNEPLQP